MEAGKVENNQAGAITMPTMLEYTPMAGPHDLERGHTLSRRGGAENQRLESVHAGDFLSASWEHVWAEA